MREPPRCLFLVKRLSHLCPLDPVLGPVFLRDLGESQAKSSSGRGALRVIPDRGRIPQRTCDSLAA
jgi:hypothetical protein